MLSRGGWILSTLAALSIALLAPNAASSISELSGSTFPDALLALGCLVQLALSTWVALAVGLGLARVPAPLLRTITPRLLRQALFAGAAGALVMAPVNAEQIAPQQPATHDLVGLRLPDRPLDTVSRPAPHREAVVVRPGDTLWAIAARSLPTDATDHDIAVACARWHEANRDVIGDDPDLIFPSQRLNPPLGKDST